MVCWPTEHTYIPAVMVWLAYRAYIPAVMVWLAYGAYIYTNSNGVLAYGANANLKSFVCLAVRATRVYLAVRATCVYLQ